MKKLLIMVLSLVAFESKGQTIMVNVENDAVSRYLDEIVYYGQETESGIISYLSGDASVRLDVPRPAVISLPTTTAEKVTVSYGEQFDFSDCQTQEVATSEGKVSIYNLIPHRTYFYKIEDDGGILTSGMISTTGRMRMIYVPGVRNVRDMGGWTCAGDKVIKYGLIYRGSELNGENVASESDIQQLKDLGIAAEIDLREASENDGAGISAFGFTAGNDDETSTYLFTDNSGCCERTHLTSYFWTQRYRKEFEFIVSNLRQGRPVYHHCIWGADRTGLLALLLQGLLGMSYEDMVKDYELTSFYLLRTKHNIDFVFDYINSLSGETLQEKFLNYFQNRLYVGRSDIEYFLSEMLEDAVVVGIDAAEHSSEMNEERFYDLQGRPSTADRKGMKIVVDRDGNSHRKVIVR